MYYNKDLLCIKLKRVSEKKYKISNKVNKDSDKTTVKGQNYSPFTIFRFSPNFLNLLKLSVVSMNYNNTCKNERISIYSLASQF